MTKNTTVAGLLCLSLSLAIVACTMPAGDAEVCPAPASPAPAPSAGGGGGNTNGNTDGGGGGQDGGTGGGTTMQAAVCTAPDQGAWTLTEAQVIQVLMASNLGEIAQAEIAQRNATDAAVRDYATMMIAEHTAANARLMTLAQNKQLTPEQSPLSQQLVAQDQQIRAVLALQTGAAFDLAYMDAQVMAHSTVAFFGDTLLVPQVTDPDVQAELAAHRAAVQQHLEQAATVQATLARPAPQLRR